MPEYRHTISGEAFGVPHEPGDRVAGDVPAEKIDEWLDAGVIEPAPQSKSKKTKPHVGSISESQETDDGSTDGSGAPDGDATEGTP